MGTRQRAIAIGLVVFTFFGVAGSAFFWTRAHRRARLAPPPAVAFVDGSPITADDVDVRLEQILPLASYHGHVQPDHLVALKRAALDDLVLDELIYREAVRQGRRAPARAVDAELAAVKARFERAEEFVAALAENGLTEAQFRERLARIVLVREARAERARPSVTDADIEAYYRENAAKFQRPERVHLLEILVRVDPAEPASAATAEKKARAILARLRRGEPFAAIASALSDDEYRVKDGDMGFVHRGRLDAPFEAAVFAAPLNRLDLARSLYGFEVFKVLERQPPAQLSLAEARPIIAEGVGRRRLEETQRAWRARLFANARIDIRDAVLRNARAATLPMDAIALGSLSRPPNPARSYQ